MQGLRDERLIRRQLRCRGLVQGVGFRPAVWRLAWELGAAGSVRNDADGATIEVEGTPAAVRAFEERLPRALPPRARLDAVEARDLAPCGAPGFEVIATADRGRGRALIPPDLALCPACRADMERVGDRRRRYPFTTCTDCGPRYSLSLGLPYDRVRTAMACFPLCDACAAEYGDPASRRFHAEPLCCPRCGPRLWVSRADGDWLGAGEEALEIARRALAQGAIVAVKGLGGFQLCCRADSPEAVRRLRARKQRGSKPFAVMVRDLGVARRLCVLSAADERLLSGPEGPIVLAPRRPDCPLPRAVAPGLHDLGLLLPTTPLHVELLRARHPEALVATSGNRSEEPIQVHDREALRSLRGIADLFLLHDRDIVRRVDDSVVRTLPGKPPLMVRRSRGYVPRALPLPEPAPDAVLALGGHLQTTACLAFGREAFPSQHVGDLDEEAARGFLLEVAAGLEGFLEVRGLLLAADLHPDYPSRWAAEQLALERGGRLVLVQHHLAHAAAVLAEHGAFPASGERAMALVLDGTGFGPDGTAWGCEWLALDGDLRWARLAQGEALPLVGGEAAVREPWRVAVAVLAEQGWSAARIAALPLGELVEAGRIEAVAALCGGRWPRATGAGRLFEAAAAILGLCAENSYEGEAASRGEALAARAEGAEVWTGFDTPSAGFPSQALLLCLAERVAVGEPLDHAAAGFHRTFCELAARRSAAVLPRGVDRVALGGGCLVNRLLVTGLTEAHARHGMGVLTALELPPGDGGLSYGQAVLAAVSTARAVPLPSEPLPRDLLEGPCASRSR
jgi:hydrogenase maturation protein HypF